MEQSFELSGVHCMHCVARVKKALEHTYQQLISRIFWYETIQYRNITGSYSCRSPQPPTESEK